MLIGLLIEASILSNINELIIDVIFVGSMGIYFKDIFYFLINGGIIVSEEQIKKLYLERKRFLQTLLNNSKITIEEYEISIENYKLFLDKVQHIE